MTPFLEDLWVFPYRPHSPFLGKCISYSVCNVDPTLGCGAAGRCGGGGLLCRWVWGGGAIA